MKRCSICGVEKEDNDFNKMSKNIDGLHYYCRECQHEKQKENYINNKTSTRERQKKYALDLRNEILNHYGGKCVCCGETRREFLAIDHINNDGNEQRKEAGGAGFTFQVWIKRQGFPNDLQILCHNCNSAKGFYGYCPHEIERNNIK
jgi:hypothetical protein